MKTDLFKGILIGTNGAMGLLNLLMGNYIVAAVCIGVAAFLLVTLETKEKEGEE